MSEWQSEPSFTPVTPAAKQYLGILWRRLELPETSFDHWSLEFAREVFEIAKMYEKPWMAEACTLRGMEPEDELLVVLDENGVFDEDQTRQQWVPEGWKAEWKW